MGFPLSDCDHRARILISVFLPSRYIQQLPSQVERFKTAQEDVAKTTEKNGLTKINMKGGFEVGKKVIKVKGTISSV